MCVSPPQKIFQLGDLRTSISELIVVLICTSVSNPGPQKLLQRGLTTSTVEYDLYGKVGTHGPSSHFLTGTKASVSVLVRRKNIPRTVFGRDLRTILLVS